MKDQKRKKILNAIGTMLIFLIAACRGSGEAFNEKTSSGVDSAKGNSPVRDIAELERQIQQFLMEASAARQRDKRNNADHSAVDLCIDGQTKSRRRSLRKRQSAGKQSGEQERTADSPVDESASSTEEDSSEEVAGKKRKADAKNGPGAKSTSQPKVLNSEEKKARKVTGYKIDIWNSLRLTNKRRMSYKAQHKTVYSNEHRDFDEYMAREITHVYYKEKIEKDIKNFSKNVATLIDQNALYFFIASRAITVVPKTRDLLWLKELFEKDSAEDEEYRTMLESLEGYYPGVFGDMLAYVEEHKPMRTFKRFPLTEWAETLGDIYVQKALEINSSMILEQNKISKVGRRYYALSYALSMILALPEVHEDLFNISPAFIERTQISYNPRVNKQSHNVLLAMRNMVKEAENESEKIEKEYRNIYSALKILCNRDAQKEPTVPELYKDIYTVLADFYEKAEVFDEKEYILLGKSAIKHQKYAKCSATFELAPGKEDPIKDCNFEHLFETNKWDIVPSTEPHYHVYYVDNGTHQSRMLGMPMYRDEEGKEHYLHTISDIVSHVEKLYEIEKNSKTIYSFKVNKKTRKWSYVREEERGLTMKDFAGYEMVFYRIKENIAKTRFTFAEFRPLKGCDRDSICIPLFLTPLMRSAVEIGPFLMKDIHNVISLMELVDAAPDVYEFNSRYKKKDECKDSEDKDEDMEKNGSEDSEEHENGENNDRSEKDSKIEHEYSDMYRYYSNLCILPDGEKKESLDCYIMGSGKPSRVGNSVVLEWYVRMPSSVNEYIHCLPSDAFREKENSEKLSAFIETLQSREHSKDSKLQSIWLESRSVEDNRLNICVKNIYIWHVNIEGSKAESAKKSQKDRETIKKYMKKSKDKFWREEQAQKILNTLAARNEKEKHEKIMKLRNVTVKKSFAKKRIEILTNQLRETMLKKPDEQAEFIVLRNVNYSKSNLGAHNEMLDVLVSWYNN
ncbi:hypothetical protein NEMIN01_2353 [Nematocida minor]|uniref:uncharacterized protein n=1 Tax=Nematocida minor TaxID=1912983 RepID=UPI002220FC41|nr:uncharacterized protein NEMIN01_2353 [Nematocida minor]KAI5193009.1 hypothetical protein NEMIN01_2353 [Nematocida minor]